MHLWNSIQDYLFLCFNRKLNLFFRNDEWVMIAVVLGLRKPWNDCSAILSIRVGSMDSSWSTFSSLVNGHQHVMLLFTQRDCFSPIKVFVFSWFLLFRTHNDLLVLENTPGTGKCIGYKGLQTAKNSEMPCSVFTLLSHAPKTPQLMTKAVSILSIPHFMSLFPGCCSGQYDTHKWQEIPEFMTH